jgi:phage-related holin
MKLKAPVDIDVSKLLDAIAQGTSIVLQFLLGTLNPQISYFYLGILIDIGLGVWVAIKEDNFSLKYLISKTLEKLVIYTVLISVGHIGDMVGGLKDQIRSAVLLGILIKEAPSFLGKLKKLGYAEEAEVIEDVIAKKDGNEGSEK